MIVKNRIGIETVFGYRTIELYLGNLADGEISVDLLVVSAFADDYTPTHGSVVGALPLNGRHRELRHVGRCKLTI